jgi:uncharacterized integral membrane protein
MTEPHPAGTPPTEPESAPPSAAAGTTPETTAGQPPAKDPLRASRAGRAWFGVVALAVVLILLIIFIAQNTRSVTVTFLGWEGNTSLAVALLIAAVAGLIIAAVAGSLRILQLRARVRRDRKRRPA